ncbi:uncharacterized protein LOC114268375 [Camellia sinensis]|uniref:uncharacterized protein LOC114268375 n=1 Tax=Camellia sinensis TaxID=4442 RepID=UPI0010369EAA|nr:uncharacterized protein LOC114268375 [Camellia sinensis]
MVRNGGVSLSEETVVSKIEAFKAEKQESSGPMFGTLQGTINQPNISSIGDDGALECGTTDADVGLNSESKLVVHEETVVMSTDVSHVVKPLNFDEFNSTAELEGRVNSDKPGTYRSSEATHLCNRHESSAYTPVCIGPSL